MAGGPPHGPMGPPALAADPGRVEFGTVNQFGGSAAAPLKLTNSGHRDLVIDGFQTGREPAFGAGKGNCIGQPIKSGQSCTVMVVFAPTTGEFTNPAHHLEGTLSVRSNAGAVSIPVGGDALFAIFG